MKIKGKKFGDWRAKKQLGQGANGSVWLAVNSKGEEAAIKILTVKDRSKILRFRDEVEILLENNDIEGVLPIIEFDLSETLGEKRPWYVMPVACPVEEYVKDRNIEERILVILEIGKTLSSLHERGISHRDVKPANILVRDEKIYLSDFGLVDFPEKQDLTRSGERVGARSTIAPEMESNSSGADGKLADVYSLAKTLWILLMDRVDGFPGQYVPQSVIGLRGMNLTIPEFSGHYIEAPSMYTKPLDDLLKNSTDHDPALRPSINQFVERLENWLEDYKVFEKTNPERWRDSQAKLFPIIMPERAIWKRIEAIIEVLNILGSSDRQCHLHLPSGGGLDLLGADIGLEPGTLELRSDSRTVCLVKPKRLVFESFGFDSGWNYFMLETGELEPTGIGHIHKKQEILVEIAPLEYISEAESNRYDERRDQDYSTSRIICRFTDGFFLIVQKTSFYNRSGYTYDGRHDQMGIEEFRDYTKENIQQVQQLLESEEMTKNVSGNILPIDELIRSSLDQKFRKEALERFMN